MTQIFDTAADLARIGQKLAIAQRQAKILEQFRTMLDVRHMFLERLPHSKPGTRLQEVEFILRLLHDAEWLIDLPHDTP